MSRKVYDEPVHVWVLHDDGRWYRGFLVGVVDWPDGTRRGEVEYTIAPGSKFLRSLTRERVRLVDES